MSNLDPEFLELEDVFELHADSIARYGGDLGVRDRGLIESAVAVPRQSFGGEYLHTTLFEMAAAYAFHIAESQGFVDGNKRAGLAAATPCSSGDLAGATEENVRDLVVAFYLILVEMFEDGQAKHLRLELNIGRRPLPQ